MITCSVEHNYMVGRSTRPRSFAIPTGRIILQVSIMLVPRTWQNTCTCWWQNTCAGRWQNACACSGKCHYKTLSMSKQLSRMMICRPRCFSSSSSAGLCQECKGFCRVVPALALCRSVFCLGRMFLLQLLIVGPACLDFQSCGTMLVRS